MQVRSRGWIVFVSSLLCVALAPAAWAQVKDPKFEYGKPDDVSGVEWKLQARAGLMLSTGNSRSTSLGAGATTSRTEAANRFGAEASLAYARSNSLLAVDGNGDGLIEEAEVSRIEQTTSQAWLLKGRYDRFFGEANSGFVTARASSDVPAGKEFVGAGQLGYSRRLYKTDFSETAIEAGYDFQYEKYVALETAAAIHSARVAMLHSTKITDTTLFTLETEGLVNLNEETAPSPTGAPTVAPLEDWRVNGGANLTTSLTDRISFSFVFKLRYDNAPAPRPPFAVPYAPGFQPFAEKLDTVTEASLIVTLL